VLGLVVTDHLYRTYPDLPEGHLAQVRAAVVNAGALAEAAAELRLGEAVRLGKGEDSSGGREKPSILSDAMEAVIGAVYLDGGWDDASTLVMDLLGERMTEAAAGPGGHDFKTRLQELGARRFDELPSYVVSSEGPDHAKRFTARVSVGGTEYGVGEGRSKKQAEQAAARMAWRALSEPVAVLVVEELTLVDPAAVEDALPDDEELALDDPTGTDASRDVAGDA
jgi:ribonuclease III